MEAPHRPPSPPWVSCPQSWPQVSPHSPHSPQCRLSGPRLPPGTGPVLAASEASWPNSGASSKMLCARRWFLGDLNQFPVAFHLRQTPLYILSQTSHLFQMIIHNACVVMSPVFSGDVDALTPGRLLTESHLCGLTQESLLTPGSTHSPPHPGLAWPLVTLILTRRRWSAPVVSAPTSCHMSGIRGEDGSVTPRG